MSDTSAFQQQMDNIKELLGGLEPEDRINLILRGVSTLTDRFTAEFFDDTFSLVSVTRPATGTAVVTFAFTVKKYYTNIMGTLHGGAQATIFDALTSLALQGVSEPKKGQWLEGGGVSRTLNVTYLRPALVGDKLLCECEVVHAGKRLCFLRGLLKRETDGAIISSCEHNKSVVERGNDWKL